MWLWLFACSAEPGAAPGGPLAPVTGQAFVFGYEGSLAGATITAQEEPSRAAVAADDGTFSLEVPSGRAWSFLVEQPGFHATQTAMIEVGVDGVTQVGFQVPPDAVYAQLAALVGVDPGGETCQLVTTVSAAGGPPYGGVGVGEPDVVVTLTPALPPEAGPIYFAFLGEDLPPLPDRRLAASSVDGGVLYVDVPPGDYVMRGEKPGVVIPPITLRCRPGLVVNAAPPWGLQVQ